MDQLTETMAVWQERADGGEPASLERNEFLETKTRRRILFECCGNCERYEHYYAESGWCRDPVNTQIFNKGLMVYQGSNCCDRFEAKQSIPQA